VRRKSTAEKMTKMAVKMVAKFLDFALIFMNHIWSKSLNCCSCWPALRLMTDKFRNNHVFDGQTAMGPFGYFIKEWKFCVYSKPTNLGFDKFLEKSMCFFEGIKWH